MTPIAALIHPSGLVAVPAPRRKGGPSGPPLPVLLQAAGNGVSARLGAPP
jgi:hypothetical protein